MPSKRPSPTARMMREARRIEAAGTKAIRKALAPTPPRTTGNRRKAA